MPLPAPVRRTHMHDRAVTYRGYLREDGLWDIEAELTDTRPFAFVAYDGSQTAPGAPVHDMAIRVTLDDSMTIREIASTLDATPLGQCKSALDPMQKMVGAKMGPGWRLSIERALGGARGCAHLRELLFNMATAAFQTMSSHRARQRQAGVQPAQPPGDEPPYHLGRCVGWDFEGAAVARHYPQFAGWSPLKRARQGMSNPPGVAGTED